MNNPIKDCESATKQGRAEGALFRAEEGVFDNEDILHEAAIERAGDLGFDPEGDPAAYFVSAFIAAAQGDDEMTPFAVSCPIITKRITRVIP